MRKDKPFWETNINPIVGYKLEQDNVLKSIKNKKYRIRVKQKLEEYERFD
jgi:hypothetical protein